MLGGNDLDRLKKEYAARSQRLDGKDYYSLLKPANLFTYQQRQRQITKLLSWAGLKTFAKSSILDLGCGNGGELLEFLRLGAQPHKLFGCDLLPNRLREAHDLLPHLGLVCADGQKLPYTDGSFDLVLQFTVFSSILDVHIQAGLAQEMLRVLKPSGLILWYDFWLNPTNPQTRGIRPNEIRKLFPACKYKFSRITLAPPISRRLIKTSWLMCAILEKLTVFNSHYLVTITR